jgi:hypothetical protein
LNHRKKICGLFLDGHARKVGGFKGTLTRKILVKQDHQLDLKDG